MPRSLLIAALVAFAITTSSGLALAQSAIDPTRWDDAPFPSDTTSTRPQKQAWKESHLDDILAGSALGCSLVALSLSATKNQYDPNRSDINAFQYLGLGLMGAALIAHVTEPHKPKEPKREAVRFDFTGTAVVASLRF